MLSYTEDKAVRFSETSVNVCMATLHQNVASFTVAAVST
jgi:Tfp pilus assembly ATPase PilU